MILVTGVTASFMGQKDVRIIQERIQEYNFWGVQEKRKKVSLPPKNFLVTLLGEQDLTCFLRLQPVIIISN